MATAGTALSEMFQSSLPPKEERFMFESTRASLENEFQSSLPPKEERFNVAAAASTAVKGFNPRSPRRRSASFGLNPVPLQENVSILAPPEGGALPFDAMKKIESMIVSILAPPEGGALPARRR